MCGHRDWMGPDDEWRDYQMVAPTFRAQRTPLEIPSARMAVESESGVSYVDGALYTAEWFAEDGDAIIEPSIPVLWPKPAKTERPCHMLILTDYMPLTVMMMGFSSDAINPETGFPLDEGAPTLGYQCGRFGTRECVHLNEDGFVELYPIPAPLMDLPYIVALITWQLHPADREGKPNDPVESQATWLFRFAERRPNQR